MAHVNVKNLGHNGVLVNSAKIAKSSANREQAGVKALLSGNAMKFHCMNSSAQDGGRN
jgi:hypothetical protein